MTKAEKTRQMIIEQAAPLFNQRGIAGTSVDDVLKAAGVAKGCLYGHFESKEALSYASVDYMLGRLAERRNSYLQTGKTGKEKLYAFLEMHKNPLKTTFAGGCPVLNFSAETDDTNPVIRGKIQAYVNQTIKALADAAAEGVEGGEFTAALKTDEFATKMYGAVEGAIMLCRIMQSTAPMQAVAANLKNELELYSKAV